jgi:hypothetical protein
MNRPTPNSDELLSTVRIGEWGTAAVEQLTAAASMKIVTSSQRVVRMRPLSPAMPCLLLSDSDVERRGEHGGAMAT